MELTIRSPDRNWSNIIPRYLTLFLASIFIPLQDILKSSKENICNLRLGPKIIISVLPKCNDSLLSTNHSWHDFNIPDNFCEMILVFLSENNIAVSSAYSKTLQSDSIPICISFTSIKNSN
jgi:hypothetical protein